jgi:hypothetical protein
MVLPALEQGGYSAKLQVKVGQRLGYKLHKVDVVAEKNARRFLVSLKWQCPCGKDA